MKTIVYVDGFNLYYGALKGTPHKWLNIHRLCQLLLPRNDLVQIKYFTALVTARAGDPDQPGTSTADTPAAGNTAGLGEGLLPHFPCQGLPRQ